MIDKNLTRAQNFRLNLNVLAMACAEGDDEIAQETRADLVDAYAALEAARARLVEAMECIKQYSLDTLSGRDTPGSPSMLPPDEKWYRAGYIEISERAIAALDAAREVLDDDD